MGDNSMISRFIYKLSRRKHVTLDDTQLPRVLNLLDLTAMGIGSTIGIGFYVLAGQVARNVAGPAVVICFLIAGIASVFSGLCYAEFGARVPKAGSAYVYSYVCVGEFVAFVIGWNLILEYVIGTSSVAKGYSSYIDELGNNVISDKLTELMPIDVNFLESFPDFLAFAIAFVISIILALGVKESTMFNNVCTGINLIVVVYTIIAAATQADINNWKISEDKLNETCTIEPESGTDWGVGGFAPYGFAGIMQGAATCFFGFVGFDCIATTGEEAKRPERNIPLSITISLAFIFVAYFGMASTLTLAVPYCMQNADAPLVDFFEQLGWNVSKWFVSIGALFGFSASLFGCMLPLPRILYAMSEDGILFRFLGSINQRFRTPLIATLLSGLFAGFMAMLFDLNSLVDMMSIGTLLAYTIVALAVMLLRYNVEDDIVIGETNNLVEKGESATPEQTSFEFMDYMRQIFNTQNLTKPTLLTQSLVNYATLLFCVTCTLVVIVASVGGEGISNGEGGPIAGLVITFVIAFVNVVVIARQPQSAKKLNFKVPFVPWLPAFSSLINIYLMFSLTADTWVRFGVWMGIGLPLYFFYGYRHSRADNWRKLHQKGRENPAGPSREFPDVADHSGIITEKPQKMLQAAPEMNSDRHSLQESIGSKKGSVSGKSVTRGSHSSHQESSMAQEMAVLRALDELGNDHLQQASTSKEPLTRESSFSSTASKKNERVNSDLDSIGKDNPAFLKDDKEEVVHEEKRKTPPPPYTETVESNAKPDSKKSSPSSSVSSAPGDDSSIESSEKKNSLAESLTKDGEKSD